MTNYTGWYIGRVMTSSVATAKAGSSPEIQDVVFDWPNQAKTGYGATVKPTVNTVEVTDLTAVVGGPYATKAKALAAADGDTNTTSGLSGVTDPATGTATAGSSNGSLPSWTDELEELLEDLTDMNLWIRVGKIVIGGIIVIVGISKMTGASNVIVKTAEKAPIPI